MAITTQPVAPGELAPGFALPAIAGSGLISLDDYRGRSPLFLSLLLGLWCPFCRRQLVQLGAFEGRLKAMGVESLAVVATAPENARLYFKFRPTRLHLAADPALSTHRAYGIPKPEVTPALLEAMETVRINPTGELPEPLPIAQAGKVLQERDGYAFTPADQGDVERQWPQLKGLFMIDRTGIVRWAYVECAAEGLAGIGKFPSEEEILGAGEACAA
ncbi:redoxin domain-containing protein [Variovorax sp. RT4R15]|uniref:redoxin domain-containing protein n=1 Tax=Variovorax sp. RT4R15 TaxID=3443737 RepID=UPI003F466DAB